MKSITPYVITAIVIAVLGVLLLRWNNSRSRVPEDIFGEGVQIENLSQEEFTKAFSEAKDFTTVDLKPAPALQSQLDVANSDNLPNLANIRYEIKDDKVRFGVTASLGDLEDKDEVYQVWLREINSDSARLAFSLEDAKAGYIGSASLSSELLPLEVLVVRGKDAPDAENILYTGVINKQ